MRALVKKVKVAGHIYKVSEVDFNKGRNGSRKLYGEVDYSKHTIKIDKFVTISNKWEILIHEVNHVFSEIYNLGWKENDVELYAQIFTEFLIDNGFIRVPANIKFQEESVAIAAKARDKTRRTKRKANSRMYTRNRRKLHRRNRSRDKD